MNPWKASSEVKEVNKKKTLLQSAKEIHLTLLMKKVERRRDLGWVKSVIVQTNEKRMKPSPFLRRANKKRKFMFVFNSSQHNSSVLNWSTCALMSFFAVKRKGKAVFVSKVTLHGLREVFAVVACETWDHRLRRIRSRRKVWQHHKRWRKSENVHA